MLAVQQQKRLWKAGHRALTEDFRVKFSSELLTSAPVALTDYTVKLSKF